MNTSFLQRVLQEAVQRLYDDFKRAPWNLMTEGDVQATLFSQIVKRIGGARKCTTQPKRGGDSKQVVMTRRVHTELQTWDENGKDRHILDLAILVEPNAVEFQTERYYRPEEGKYRVGGYYLGRDNIIGIEIKVNQCFSDTAGKNFRNLRRPIAYDIKKLSKYKRGWFIFVDFNSLFRDKKEWKNFMSGIIRKTCGGRLKSTISAYYLAPKYRQAWAYKPWYQM